MPAHGPSTYPINSPKPTLPMLKNVDANAGTKNWLHAFSTPMACAASATSSRNGNMIRVITTASANLAGSERKPVARTVTSAGAKTTPSAQIVPTTTMSAVATRFASSTTSLRLRVVRYSVKVGTNADERAPSANRSRVRLGMRKPRLNASITAPAPNSRLMTLSRTKPVMRLMKTATDTTPAERTTLSDEVEGPALGAPDCWTISRSVLFKEVCNRHDPVVEVSDLVFLVR